MRRQRREMEILDGCCTSNTQQPFILVRVSSWPLANQVFRANPEGAKRNLASISPFFIVKDLSASISHYIERFGFQLDFQGPPEDVYYGQVSRDGIGIMLKAILPDVLPRSEERRVGKEC